MIKDKEYIIHWRDHFSSEGFFSENLDELHKDMTLTSVGFFLEEDENYFRFARTVVNEDKQYADIMSIAKALVLSIHKLEVILL